MKKTLNNKINKNKTFKNKNNYSHSKMIVLCLEILNTVKLFHWKTNKYSEHKATDELYSELNDKIDNFIEVLIGKDGKRININKTTIKLNDFNNSSNFKKYIEKAKMYLIGMTNSKILNKKENSDLLNIRDEILGILNKFTYLLTFE